MSCVVSKMLGNSDPPPLYCHDVKSEGNQIMAIVVRNKTLQRNVWKLANFHWGKMGNGKKRQKDKVNMKSLNHFGF